MTNDDIEFTGIWINETIADGPAARWPEMDQEIWLFLAEGGIDDGISGEAWTNRIWEALSVLNRIESHNWELRDAATNEPIDHHAVWEKEK
jgi:hypothetical protein